MSWLGANVSKRARTSQADDRKRRDETVEAALNRLSKAYNTAMDCVGAWHRASQWPNSDTEKLRFVGWAARTAFERAILLDPLICLPHAPIFRQTFQQTQQSAPYGIPTESPVELRSPGHKATIEQLAYLGLINYGDLLIAGCGKSQATGASILERGLTPALRQFSHDSAWKRKLDDESVSLEDEETTVRLALAAYIDATDLDSSDPTVWIKLACTSRRLGRILMRMDASGDDGDVESIGRVIFLPYRRLERHALEQAVLALPSSVPPSRLAKRALEEWEEEQEQAFTGTYSRVMVKSSELEAEFTAPVLRYTWSTLGRMLLRLVLEGVQLPASETPSSNVQPNVKLQMSPMLTLPLGVLGSICQYLCPSDIYAFEATCRALSSSVVAARAFRDHKAVRREPVATKPAPKTIQPQPPPRTSSAAEDLSAKTSGSRASKRVRSQMISSGKRSEREYRRSSTKFCLLAATMGCTADNPRYLKGVDSKTMTSTARTPASHSTKDQSASSGRNLSRKLQGVALLRLVQRYSNIAVMPIEALFGYVASVALNVEEAFTSDPNSYLLTPLLLECLDCLSDTLADNDYGRHDCWLRRNPLYMIKDVTWLDLFAADLLDAELCLMRCERSDAHTFDFTSWCRIVDTKVLYLESKLQNAPVEDDLTWLSLKCRCHWLTAGYYLWRCKMANNISDGRQAEMLGVESIERAMQCLVSQAHEGLHQVAVPHLSALHRKHLVWKELNLASLSSFKNDVLASSILLHTEEKFQDALAKMDGLSGDDHLSLDHCTILGDIGESLFARYKSGSDDDASTKHTELVVDLLQEHGSTLLSSDFWDGKVDRSEVRKWFSSMIPIGRMDKAGDFLEKRRPCLLTIILLCIQTEGGRQNEVFHLLVEVCASLLELFEAVSAELAEISEALTFRSKDAENDSDEDSLGDYMDGAGSAADRDEKRSRLRQYAILFRLLVERVEYLCQDCPQLRVDVADVSNMMERGFRIVSLWFTTLGPQIAREGDLMEDLRMYKGIISLVQTAFDRFQNVENYLVVLNKCYLKGVVELIEKQQLYVKTLLEADCDRRGRSLRSKLLRRRCDLVALICCKLALFLTKHPVQVVDGSLARAEVFGESTSTESESQVASLCRSLLWLWGTVNETGKVDSAIDQACADRLRVPVACAIASLAGAASSTGIASFDTQCESEKLRLVEFYDSDSSVTQWRATTAENELEAKAEHLLQVLAQAIQCVANVFSSVSEKESITYPYTEGYQTKHGPTLPLVVTRVLSTFADQLLLNFSQDGSQSPLWSSYEHGTRMVGQTLDSLLHKAYKCIYGFTLTSEGKDASTTVVVDEMHQNNTPEESPSAAAALYRCILRSYSNSRRSPPKAALDTILTALPESSTTSTSSEIQKYLFSNDNKWTSANDWKTFVTHAEGWDSSVAFAKQWIMDNKKTERSSHESEANKVRRGVSKMLAESSVSTYNDGGSEDDLRAAAVQEETESSKKFLAVLDCLSLGDVTDFDAWYSAAQCLSNKANVIADRLGLTSGFLRGDSFVPTESADNEQTCSYEDLWDEQIRENGVLEEGWLQCLGKDLSVYVRHNWSSLESIEVCSREVLSGFRDVIEQCKASEQTLPFEIVVWQQIEKLRSKSDLVAWQQAWGGLFISALRKMAFRCYRLALFNVHHAQSAETDIQIALSEIFESLGIAHYRDLMGSQQYGYPMGRLSTFRKREIAQASLTCFEKSVETASTPDEVLRTSWDLKFMIGKCHQKIANTFFRERFINSGESNATRKYELHMKEAFKAYNDSLVEARELEKHQELIVNGSGGSAHGSAESLYRLHASRIKCLIKAVKCEDRKCAELEALRLTECYWFSNVPVQDGSLSVRERVWNVLVDSVSALAQIRPQLQYFHRSVYRHAQALMWAPILSDPVGQRANGCYGTVPAVMATKLRGWDSAANGATSGTVIMSILFEKRRQQLCAVWVTGDSSHSAFQLLNASTRKYDSVRGKYTAAYIECLRLSGRKEGLESFLKLVYTCKRDLPCYFAFTAAEKEGKAKKSHTQDSLIFKPRLLSSLHFLVSVKRLANLSFASLLLKDVYSETVKNEDKESLLKQTYACFLRLNCTAEDLARLSCWRYRRSGAKTAVKALIAAYQLCVKDAASSEQPGNWSTESFPSNILSEALRVCKKRFPTFTGSLLTAKKKPVKLKDSGTKRKDPPVVGEDGRRPFEVSIPEGLAAGESFVATITDGDTLKKVRLTVPQGASNTLRFRL